MLIQRQKIRKFDITYLIRKEQLAFTKMAMLCELEEKHGVDLGPGYKNEKASNTFVHYIVQAQRELLTRVLTKAMLLFSIQADGSTDRGNVEDKVFLVC